MSPKQKPGFTLPELLVALTIITILTFSAVPLFQQTSGRAFDRQLSEKLYDLLLTAKQSAKIKNVPVGFRLDKQNQVVIFVDKYKDGEIKNKNQKLIQQRLELKKGILKWRAYPHYRNYLVFQAGSIQRSDNASIWYCHADAKEAVWVIFINRSGVIRKQIAGKDDPIKDSQGEVLNC